MVGIAPSVSNENTGFQTPSQPPTIELLKKKKQSLIIEIIRTTYISHDSLELLCIDMRRVARLMTHGSC